MDASEFVGICLAGNEKKTRVAIREYASQSFQALASAQFPQLLTLIQRILKQDLLNGVKAEYLTDWSKSERAKGVAEKCTAAGNLVRSALAALVNKAILACREMIEDKKSPGVASLTDQEKDQLRDAVKVLQRWRKHHRTGYYLQPPSVTIWILGEYLRLEESLIEKLVIEKPITFSELLGRIREMSQQIADELVRIRPGCFGSERGLISQELVELTRDAFFRRFSHQRDRELGIEPAFLGEFGWFMSRVRHNVCTGVASLSFLDPAALRRDAQKAGLEYEERDKASLFSLEAEEIEAKRLLTVDAAVPDGKLGDFLKQNTLDVDPALGSRKLVFAPEEITDTSHS